MPALEPATVKLDECLLLTRYPRHYYWVHGYILMPALVRSLYCSHRVDNFQSFDYLGKYGVTKAAGRIVRVV